MPTIEENAHSLLRAHIKLAEMVHQLAAVLEDLNDSYEKHLRTEHDSYYEGPE